MPANRRESGALHDENFGGASNRISLSRSRDQKDRRKSRMSFGGGMSPGGGLKKRKSSLGVEGRQRLADMYSTILKMSSENKINQKNSWSLHLIDHIDDAIDESEESLGNEGFNFQRASCTLDASIKIYSYRVDDTYTASFKVLENINRGNSGKESDADGQDDTLKKESSKRVALACTLEKNVNNINMRHLDVESDVDPMFQKMSQKFDEGGASGMLLNNLFVSDGCEIVFDSADTIGGNLDAAPADQGDWVDSRVNIETLEARLREMSTNINELHLIPSLQFFYSELGGAISEAPLSIAHRGGSLKEFSSSLAVFPDNNVGGLSDGGNLPVAFAHAIPLFSSISQAVPAPPGGLPLVDDVEDVDEDYEAGDLGNHGGLDWSTDDANEEQSLRESLGCDGGSLPFNVPVPHASGQSSVALVPPLSASAAAAVGVDALLLRSTVDDEYSFFDPRLVAALTKRAWMGPGAGGLAAAAGHWKVGVRFSARQKVPGGELLADTQTAYKKGDSSKVKKRGKKTICFSGKPDRSSFAAPLRASSTANCLSVVALEKAVAASESLLLPDDIGYKPHDLFRLFTNPKKIANVLGCGGVIRFGYAADNAAVAVVGITGGVPAQGDGDAAFFDCGDSDTEGGGDGPSFFAGGVAEFMGDDDEFGGVDLVAAARTVEKIDIKFATVAKKVDVKKLKENLWSQIEEELPLAPKPAAIDSDPQHPPNASSFRHAVDEMAKEMPDNVTISFYFICLLHLANEKGLVLEGREDLSDIAMSKVQGC